MPLQIQTAQVALMERRDTEDNASGKMLRAEIRCALPEARATEIALAPAWLCLQIHAVNLSTQEVELLVSQARVLQAERSDEAFVLEFAAPAAGRYQSQIVAFLLSPTPQIASCFGPLLRVEAEESDEAMSAPGNFESALRSECDSHPAESENSAQDFETRLDAASTADPAMDEELLCSEEISTPPASANEAQELAPTAVADEAMASALFKRAPQFHPTKLRAAEALRPRFRRLPTALQIPLEALSLIGLVVLGFSFPFRPSLGEQQTDLFEIERTLQRLQAIAQKDRERNSDLKKILVIMERYAPDMRAGLKFEIANTIHEMTIKYSNLDLELICATITHETGRSWNPRSISPVGARGLMQIMPLTGEMLAQAEGVSWSTPEKVLFDPITNLRLGCRYLSALVNAYHVDGGLAAYNGGEKRAELWLRQGRAAGILASETSYYVPSILKLYAEYRRMRG